MSISTSYWEACGLRVSSSDEYIHFQSVDGMRLLSSGVHGGGLRPCRHVVNFKVSHDYDNPSPQQDLQDRLRRLGINGEDATALMTAALLVDAGWFEVRQPEYDIFGCVTTGFANAARVTDDMYQPDRPGTINIIVVVNGSMTDDALVGTVISVTEAKAAALADLGVRSPSGSIATGTTTDALVVASTGRSKETIAYAGLATQFGRDVSRAVYGAICESGRRYLARVKADVGVL
ncbi:adenosylcobinamide amidohydrolase [Alicyclobacillus dauci]|uniref:Adenosylcobinamide amidohydrolase n=1 Tax=Alicyclobacillus dauci TaxID=1475485 RepID=A0ABY6Z1F2_9BACL|nr:adenosylcobinamide amidohydrolase [Alicyclobacillus dauci]WAH36149.1 adenosylcobinamide amidohydrolase [Alicyclobacillus dauci]